MSSTRVLLPPESMGGQFVYVSPLRLHTILRRRESRAKSKVPVGPRPPYIHESRSLHAKRRARSNGGRFEKRKAAAPETEGPSIPTEGQSCEASHNLDSNTSHSGHVEMEMQMQMFWQNADILARLSQELEIQVPESSQLGIMVPDTPQQAVATL